MSNEYTDKLVDGMSNDLLPGRKTKVKTAKKRYFSGMKVPTEAPLDDLVDDFPPIPEHLQRKRTDKDRWVERGFRRDWITKKQATEIKHQDTKKPQPVFNGAKLDHVKMSQKQYQAWCKDVVDNMQRACDFHNIIVPQDMWKSFRHLWKEEFTEGLMYNDSTHGELVPIEIEKE